MIDTTDKIDPTINSYVDGLGKGVGGMGVVQQAYGLHTNVNVDNRNFSKATNFDRKRPQSSYYFGDLLL